MNDSKLTDFCATGRIKFPLSIRHYVDYGCNEYDSVSMEKKALDIAFHFYHGGDIEKEIIEMLANHPEYNEEHMIDGLLGIVSFLRTGDETLPCVEADDGYVFLSEVMSLREAIDLLREELLLRYEYHRSTDSKIKTFHVDVDKMLSGKNPKEQIALLRKPMTAGLYFTMDELKWANPWPSLMWQLYRNGNWTIHRDDNPIVYKEDWPVVESYNRRCRADSRLILDIPPEPYRGNMVDPKVVVLGLNPGYVERLNGTLPSMLKQECINEFAEALHDNLNMKRSKVVFNELDNVIGDGYWMQKFSNVKKDLNDKDDSYLGRWR